jgi:hypothetical protein
MTDAAAVCSPLGLDTFVKSKSCFSLSSLQELVTSWNAKNPDNKINPSQDAKKLRSELKKKLAKQCPGASCEACWINELGGASQNREAAKMVMPQKPKDWKKNPRKWLNNYDIQHILARFEGDKKYPYKLLGVFPIDFLGKDEYGNILYPEMYDFQLSKYVGKYKFLGMITNLDTHEGPGTHWTSTFIVIDPTLKSFGAYYYDSTFNKNTQLSRVPESIQKFFKILKKQAEELPEAQAAKATFQNIFYTLDHQKGNTECGMFSIFYQANWLNQIIKNKDATHDNILRLKVNDNQVWKLRDFFFAS